MECREKAPRDLPRKADAFQIVRKEGQTVASPKRTTVKEQFTKGNPVKEGTAWSKAGVEVTWKDTPTDRVDVSAEEAKVGVAEAPGMG